jgi:hypothetical protein
MTKGDMGRMIITVLGMVADMELKFIKDRQRAASHPKESVNSSPLTLVVFDLVRRSHSQGLAPNDAQIKLLCV